MQSASSSCAPHSPPVCNQHPPQKQQLKQALSVDSSERRSASHVTTYSKALLPMNLAIKTTLRLPDGCGHCGIRKAKTSLRSLTVCSQKLLGHTTLLSFHEAESIASERTTTAGQVHAQNAVSLGTVHSSEVQSCHSCKNSSDRDLVLQRSQRKLGTRNSCMLCLATNST